MKIEISATSRKAQGTGASRRLRKAGRVPGIVYGSSEPIMIELDHNNLYHALRKEAFHASVLTLDHDGKKEQVLLRDFQMHPFRQQVLHIDFERVLADKKIHMKVPLHFINADIAPGVKAGGVISHVISELTIACLPAALPKFIELDLSGLTLGHSVHVSDPESLCPATMKKTRHAFNEHMTGSASQPELLLIFSPQVLLPQLV